MHLFSISDADMIEATKKMKAAADVFFCNHCDIFIYNLSLKSGAYLNIWRTTKVFPVFKSGDRNDVQNYRVGGNFDKIFESVIAKYMYSHINILYMIVNMVL